MGNLNLLFESIFKRKLSALDNLEYLTQITNEYPYFSAAQFFLLLKTGKETTDYQQQAAKTSILFNNPYWLQFQMQEIGQDASGINNTGFADNNQSLPVPTLENNLPDMTELNGSGDNNETGNINNPETEEGISNEDASINNNDELPSQPKETAIDILEGNESGSTINESVILHPAETTEDIVSENTTGLITNENIILDQEINVAEIKPGTEAAPITEYEFNAVNSEPIVSHEPEIGGEIIDTIPSGHFNNESSPLENEAETEDETINEQEIEPLNFKLNIGPVNTTEDKITYEPLHTSDYFASLGIKLSGEIQPTDKLGIQLKSFTEWLKTMKKIHGNQLPQQSGLADISIQKLAEQSNKEDAVVTEAMADVLLQQGKAEKAIEVFKKLSLLNPSKSAYFAAKIDQLKEP